MCYFSEDYLDEIAMLKKGDTVTVVGAVKEGTNLLGVRSVFITECGFLS